MLAWSGDALIVAMMAPALPQPRASVFDPDQ
jgi:hypothetical protein